MCVHTVDSRVSGGDLPGGVQTTFTQETVQPLLRSPLPVVPVAAGPVAAVLVHRLYGRGGRLVRRANKECQTT